jgi:hypothetical protein
MSRVGKREIGAWIVKRCGSDPDPFVQFVRAVEDHSVSNRALVNISRADNNHSFSPGFRSLPKHPNRREIIDATPARANVR